MIPVNVTEQAACDRELRALVQRWEDRGVEADAIFSALLSHVMEVSFYAGIPRRTLDASISAVWDLGVKMGLTE